MVKSEAFGCFEGVCNGSNELDGILSILDFPLENLEGSDGVFEDWDVSSFPPIPSDVLISPLASSSSKHPVEEKSTDISRNFRQLKPEGMQERSLVQSPSPDSVLEITLPPSGRRILPDPSWVRKEIRSKRSRPSSRDHPWFSCDIKKMSCEERTDDHCGRVMESLGKRCVHCQATKTPQWREGPSGPRTLCNACGVRFRTGRLFPEYRPANSPTFVPSLHSNSHKKVVEMRNRARQEKAMWW